MVSALHAPPSFEATDTTPQVSGDWGPSPRAEPTLLEPPPTLEPPAQPEFALPPWFTTVLNVLCAAVVIAVVGALIWLGLRDRLMVRARVATVADPEQVRRRVRERVQAAVDEGLSDLDVSDDDPRRAVIACWARLEAAAAAAGTQRQPGDTSTELVERLLADHDVTASVLAEFAAVYRQARFAPSVIDDRMREQARAALRQVRDELVRPVDPVDVRSPS
ncbi:MAG: DUF4129 domain-containing protein [Micromonosporaceae bacterium]|nr:DUF4129 domain-containing protein [Micromonosporaceae bacterium]